MQYCLNNLNKTLGYVPLKQLEMFGFYNPLKFLGLDKKDVPKEIPLKEGGRFLMLYDEITFQFLRGKVVE